MKLFRMTLESLRAFCLSLPHAGEKTAWESHILFTIADKMFCISTFEPANPTKMTFKCAPELFAELCERENVIPAPYIARNHWVSLTEWDALPAAEIKESIRESYRLVFERLPKKKQLELATAARSNGEKKKLK
ncbi:MAG: MmcQ/YjbR family DNA-binding protein [Acidobacteriaceae bacterium]